MKIVEMHNNELLGFGSSATCHIHLIEPSFTYALNIFGLHLDLLTFIYQVDPMLGIFTYMRNIGGPQTVLCGMLEKAAIEIQQVLYKQLSGNA